MPVNLILITIKLIGDEKNKKKHCQQVQTLNGTLPKSYAGIQKRVVPACFYVVYICLVQSGVLPPRQKQDI